MRFTGTYDQAMINTIKVYHAEAIEMIPEIADLPLIIDLNSRMRSCGGTAQYSPYKSLIKLNYRLHRDNPSEIKNTYLHELAHIITRLKYGRNGVDAHGWQWKSVMRSLGRSPERCHKMDVSALKNKTTRIAYKCGCQVHNITKQRHNKIMRGTGSYQCGKCKQKIVRA